MRISFFASFVVLLAACGGSVETPDPTGSGGAGAMGSSSTGNVSTGGSGGGSASDCPVNLPANGDACAPDMLFCTYGESARPECRQQATCSNGKFVADNSACTESPPGTCLAQPPMNGTDCTAEGAACPYPDGTICVCSSCPGGPCMQFPKWQCNAPAAGCPVVVPNAGTACSMDGQTCTYGFPCGPSGMTTECKMGAWTWQKDITCPL